jgi:hypothetical protein
LKGEAEWFRARQDAWEVFKRRLRSCNTSEHPFILSKTKRTGDQTHGVVVFENARACFDGNLEMVLLTFMFPLLHPHYRSKSPKASPHAAASLENASA